MIAPFLGNSMKPKAGLDSGCDYAKISTELSTGFVDIHRSELNYHGGTIG
jgi:hypothetical protein